MSTLIAPSPAAAYQAAAQVCAAAEATYRRHAEAAEVARQAYAVTPTPAAALAWMAARTAMRGPFTIWMDALTARTAARDAAIIAGVWGP